MIGKSTTQTPNAGVSDDRPSWLDLALCAQTGSAFFFPEPGSSVREAKQICLACEGRAACLEYALANDERFGVWGGLSEKERERLRKGPARRSADRA
ncbi:WhiB family transcriptional regulator [Streptomyces sp. LHD-70]|uniref:WhiB family transcriptional regulator n=1 Tax=Streptomyces sp. LHD-70 TaxID=3072140 RepID=UPI00280D59B1|nr:WhiB family transcriptional regulator [Streptomyces sp. LHD-70]MDQ8706281.1 WhiB family transcriptional regulator [Streptomyces sp. LHD-70]